MSVGYKFGYRRFHSAFARHHNGLDFAHSTVNRNSSAQRQSINETRLQYIKQSGSQVGDNTIPSINVLGAFNGGGAQVGNNWTNENHWELHNITSIAHGTHAFKIGGRMRRVGYEESSARNFGGTFSFRPGNPSAWHQFNRSVPSDGGRPFTGLISC